MSAHYIGCATCKDPVEVGDAVVEKHESFFADGVSAGMFDFYYCADCASLEDADETQDGEGT